MSDISSNGHPENGSANEPFVPRIAPPQGQRAARGQLSTESAEEPLSNEVFTSQENADLLESEPVLTVADAPALEDSYSPPLDLDPDGPVVPTTMGSGVSRPDTPKDAELGLFEHLAELRQRILKCFAILMVGMMLTWNYSKPLQAWFSEPIEQVLKGHGTMVGLEPMGFFNVAVQFSLVSAIILTAPLLFWQIWLFIEPALTHAERRYTLVVVPFATVLFFMGAGLGYMVSPLFFKFFLAFQPEGVLANWNYTESIVIMAKMLLAFGVMFQVPVIVIFLNKLGVLSRNVLIDYWRHAVIVIFVVAAVLTPTWDPLTLLVCAGPPCLLYVLSIWLVKWL
jgi:sec-independent protein translocase protein TatC